jgi:hypothetical protein
MEFIAAEFGRGSILLFLRKNRNAEVLVSGVGNVCVTLRNTERSPVRTNHKRMKSTEVLNPRRS